MQPLTDEEVERIAIAVHAEAMQACEVEGVRTSQNYEWAGLSEYSRKRYRAAVRLVAEKLAKRTTQPDTEVE